MTTRTTLTYAGRASAQQRTARGWHNVTTFSVLSEQLTPNERAALHAAGWASVMLRERDTHDAGYGWFWVPPQGSVRWL